jgi:hypothetical protein
MRIATMLLASAAALSLVACNSPQDKAAEQRADTLENQAASTNNEATERSLNNQADAIEQQAGNADGGATTNNTPNTSPSGSGAH